MVIKEIQPMYNGILVTANAPKDKIGNIYVESKIGIEVYQTVVAIGSMVKEIKVGDVVMINPARYEVKKYDKNSIKKDIVGENPTQNYNFNMVSMNNTDYLMLYDSDVSFIIKDMDENVEPEIKHIDPVIGVPPKNAIEILNKEAAVKLIMPGTDLIV